MHTRNRSILMNKRLISIMLLSAIAAASLSCGNEVIETDETTIAKDDTSTEDIYSILKNQDFDSAEIRILGYGASNSYNDADSFSAEQTGEVIDDAIYQRNIDTEQLLNVKLTYDASLAERDSQSRFTNGVLAGDQNCDIFIHKSGYFGAFFTAGVILPWDGVEGLNTDQPWYVKSANETIKIGNKQYALFGDVSKTNITMCWTTAFNKRLIAEYNLESPYEIVKRGEWTMDKLMNMTKDIWSDLNGNGKADESDVYGYYTDSFATLDSFMVTHGLHATTKDSEGFPITDFYSERLVKSFEKIYQLYWENTGTYVDTAEPYTYVIDFAEGRAVFSPILLDYYIGQDLRSMNDDYGILPQPKLDDEQENYSTFLLGRTGIAMLPADISDEKLSMIGYVLDALNAYSYKMLRPAIYTTSLTSKGVRDEQSLEMLDLIMESRLYDFSGFTEIGGSYPFTPALTYRNLLAKKDVNITSYYESNRSKAENYFEAYKDMID